ncbi:hypothetical protein LMG33818_002485 [Halomonadaceae bacterium LMG 33818]|uniref:hypothetical protein n=1 Tax=Cernens ardua TaxID=3402176 RepID=UPI003EDC833B
MSSLVWIVVFLVVAIGGYVMWDGFFGNLIKSYVPEPLKPEEASEKSDRIIWPVVTGILIATLIVHPLSMIITLVLMAIIAFVALKVVRFALSKIHS